MLIKARKKDWQALLKAVHALQNDTQHRTFPILQYVDGKFRWYKTLLPVEYIELDADAFTIYEDGCVWFDALAVARSTAWGLSSSNDTLSVFSAWYNVMLHDGTEKLLRTVGTMQGGWLSSEFMNTEMYDELHKDNPCN